METQPDDLRQKLLDRLYAYLAESDDGIFHHVVSEAFGYKDEQVAAFRTRDVFPKERE